MIPSALRVGHRWAFSSVAYKQESAFILNFAVAKLLSRPSLCCRSGFGLLEAGQLLHGPPGPWMDRSVVGDQWCFEKYSVGYCGLMLVGALCFHNQLGGYTVKFPGFRFTTIHGAGSSEIAWRTSHCET